MAFHSCQADLLLSLSFLVFHQTLSLFHFDGVQLDAAAPVLLRFLFFVVAVASSCLERVLRVEHHGVGDDADCHDGVPVDGNTQQEEGQDGREDQLDGRSKRFYD